MLKDIVFYILCDLCFKHANKAAHHMAALMAPYDDIITHTWRNLNGIIHTAEKTQQHSAPVLPHTFYNMVKF